MISSLLVFSCTISLRICCFELPNYINRCSLSDPNLNACVVQNGNAAIPRLIQGDVALAISSIATLNITTLVDVPDLEMLWFNSHSDDMRHFKLTEVSFDLRPGRTSFYEGYINHFVVRGTDYNIHSGNIIDIPAYGSGNFNMTLDGVTIRASGRMSLYEKDGETYLNAALNEVSTNISRAYYYFNNIHSPCVDDVNAYIEENWEKFTQQMTPSINTHYGAFISYSLEMITNKVPLAQIFLP